jgi:DNA-binding transcriptional LysR family regulator
MKRITTVNTSPADQDRLDGLDLNLLRTLDALMRERRVSRAAEVLGLSQPAVSNALARLRRSLGDPVFLRSPGGLVPTAQALRLADAAAPALQSLREALGPQADFNPQQSERGFCLALSDIGEIYFLPQLVPHLAAQAPGVRLTTVQPEAIELQAALESGSVDLALGHLPTMPGRFRQRRLFEQRYVCLLRQGHPLLERDSSTRRERPQRERPQRERLARDRLSMRDYLAAQHLVVVAAGTGHGLVEDVLRRQGIARRVALTVPHFVASAHILAATDLVATVPERLADRVVEPFGLVALGHPVELPRSPITMLWHERTHGEAAQRWLRTTLVELFAAPR